MSYIEVLKKPLVDHKGAHLFSIRLLHEFGQNNGYLDAAKVRDLWQVFKKNPVLFTDEIEGNFDRFLSVLMNPLSVWFEIYDELDATPKGVYVLTDVYRGYEAFVHIAYWDRCASGREQLSWEMMERAFIAYDLNRLTAEIPSYQSGTIRVAKRLGLKHEGTRREGVKRNGEWVDIEVLGILRRELEEVRHAAETAKRNTA